MFSVSPSSRQPPRAPWTIQRLIHARAIALGNAIDRSTAVAYTSHLQSYLTFCKLHNFPVAPTADTLSFYVVYMSHHIKPSSVQTYLSGICHQLQNDFPDVHAARRHRLVTRTLAGCKRLYGSPVRRKHPLTLQHIHLLLARYPPTSHDNRLFRCQLVAGFLGLHRLGELCDPDRAELRSSRKRVTRASVSVSSDGVRYTLPAHKADRFFGGSDVVIPSRLAELGDVAPVTLFTDYLSSRDAAFPFHSPLWLTSSGAVPTRSWFLARLRTVIPDAAISGHSLRAGGATFFASCGWPDDRIQALGRWSSEAFRIYIREHPVLLQALLFAQRPPSACAGA